MYEIAPTRVERKWFGVRPCFLKIGLYINSGNLQLPISSLVEEFKIGKAYPEIKSGAKWSAVKPAQEAECSLQIKDIGVTQANRAGLGSTSNKVVSIMEQRAASAVTQAKQCPWTKWNDKIIKLSWKSLIAILAISFLLRSTYDLLPNATNLKL